MNAISSKIELGNAVLGIELGSTRIKAVLIDENNQVIASGDHEWENQLIHNTWTYDLADAWTGVQNSYANLVKDVESQYGVVLTKVAALGFSGMMHGYLPFDKEGNQLAPFRTWRNTMTEKEANELTELFQYNIPQRWSIAHLYQAIRSGEAHVGELDYLTTLVGYIHWKLTGKKVLGVGEASGMFPVNIENHSFHGKMLDQFQQLVAGKGYGWTIHNVLPKILVAGENAGCLTEEGAKLIDPTGRLESGIPMCPPEGDAGTGMVATNSITKRTGNVSAGTSVFAMVVLEKELSKVYQEIDLVTTPSGNLVAMAHCNNCTSDLNAWVTIFKEFQEAMGMKVDMNALYETLYRKALEGDAECGGLLAYNYFSGEHVMGLHEGRPLFVRTPESTFNLANFMRVHLFTSLGALKVGMDILLKEEGVQLERLLGHGGLFKTKEVGQRILSAAMNVPVSIMETAGEGGAWGIALLASYLVNKEEKESLDAFLLNKVFQGDLGVELMASKEDVEGYEIFIERYKNGINIEHAAVNHL